MHMPNRLAVLSPEESGSFLAASMIAPRPACAALWGRGRRLTQGLRLSCSGLSPEVLAGVRVFLCSWGEC